LKIPIVETHRGVGIHDFQDPDHIREVVKPEIDRVFAMSDARELFAYAEHYLNPPEARLFAGAKYKAMHELRASAHETRLGRLEHLNAALAGLDSLNWIDPWHIGCILEVEPPGARRRPPRSPHQQARIEAVKRAER
jgi:hypothetical protein